MRLPQLLRYPAFVFASLFISLPCSAQDTCSFDKHFINTTFVEQSQAKKDSYVAFQCTSEFSTHDEVLRRGFDGGLSFLGISLKAGETFSKSRRDTWKKDNCKAEDSQISNDQHYRILTQDATLAVAARMRCLHDEAGRVGLSCDVEKNDERTATFKLRWTPAQGDKNGNPQIVGKTLLGGHLPAKGFDPFVAVGKKPAIIKQGDGTDVLVEREQDGTIDLTVYTTRGDCSAFAENPAPPKPPPPVVPRFEKRWESHDENGQPYHQAFVVNRSADTAAGRLTCALTKNQFDVTVAMCNGSYRINNAPVGNDFRALDVTYSCVGQAGFTFCDFSTHPVPGFGYRVAYTFDNDKKGFSWSRMHGGGTGFASEVYNVTYEVYRDVCVENCP